MSERTIEGEGPRVTDPGEPQPRVPTDQERSNLQLRRNQDAWLVKCGHADGALDAIEEQAERKMKR